MTGLSRCGRQYRPRALRIEWWRRFIPKIGRCRSALLGVQCDGKRWHVGWHESGDIEWGKRWPED